MPSEFLGRVDLGPDAPRRGRHSQGRGTQQRSALGGHQSFDLQPKEVGPMANVLIPYGSTEGQTAKIADVLIDVIRDLGHEAEAVDIKRACPTRCPTATTP